jgi:SAM-dependent methyltransferase
MDKKKICFVIMPFRIELKEVYDYGIKPAIDNCEYECVRADETIGAINITKIIIKNLFYSDIIIADLTGHNPNVFYELGIAHSIGNKTIMITQDINSIPFDIKSYRIISYDQTIEGAQRLKKNLEKEIRNIDTWGKSPSNPVQDFGQFNPISKEIRDIIDTKMILHTNKNVEENKLCALAKRLITLMLEKKNQILLQIFRDSITHDLAKYIKEGLIGLSELKKDQIQWVLEEVYRSSFNLYEDESIRQNCCYYMCFLQTPHSNNFLSNVLINEKSLFVKRGIYMGMILTRDSNKHLKDYLEQLNSNALISSINAGYHQCYYGDKFFNEGYYFSENVSNVSTISAIISHLSNPEYKINWAIDLFTLNYLVYYCSTSVLNPEGKDLIDKISRSLFDYSQEIKSEIEKLQETLTSIITYKDPISYEETEYLIYKNKFIKKLPSLQQIIDIYEEYAESVYIDGEFFPHLKNRDYIKDFKSRIEKDNEKANYLVDIILSIPIIKEKAQMNILDIGCGYGTFINCWQKKLLGIGYGIDISNQAKEVSYDIYGKLNIDTIDSKNIEEVISKIIPDIVCSFDFLEHCLNVEFFLNSIGSAVKANSFFLLYIPLIKLENISVENLITTKYFHKHHIYYFTYQGIVELVERNGFQLVFNKEIRESKYLLLFIKDPK